MVFSGIFSGKRVIKEHNGICLTTIPDKSEYHRTPNKRNPASHSEAIVPRQDNCFTGAGFLSIILSVYILIITYIYNNIREAL